MRFTSTTHKRCVYRIDWEGKMVLVLRQVDNFMIACTKEKIASDITNIIGTKVRFKSKEKRGELPIQFLGLVDDYNGVDINQTDSYIKMSAKRYLERFLASHGWGISSDKVDEAFQDCMKSSSKPLAPLPMDSISQLFNQEGP